MSWKAKLKFALAGIVIGGALVFYYKESNIISVDKVVNRDRVVTRIVERPGQKITEIIKDSTKIVEHLENKSPKKDWTVGVTSTLNETVPVYGIQVSRRIIFDLSVGVFATTEGSLGALVQYSF